MFTSVGRPWLNNVTCLSSLVIDDYYVLPSLNNVPINANRTRVSFYLARVARSMDSANQCYPLSVETYTLGFDTSKPMVGTDQASSNRSQDAKTLAQT